MNKDLQTIGNQQLEVFKNDLAKKPLQEGKYFIPDARLEEWDTPKIQLLSWLLTRLAINHHEYIWQQSESLNPTQRGILIRWMPKKRTP